MKAPPSHPKKGALALSGKGCLVWPQGGGLSLNPSGPGLGLNAESLNSGRGDIHDLTPNTRSWQVLLFKCSISLLLWERLRAGGERDDRG